MNELVARLRLQADGSQLVAETNRSNEALKKTGAAADVAQKGLNQAAAADRSLTKDAGAAAGANDRLGRELDGVAKSSAAAARGAGQAATETRRLEGSARGASGAGSALALVLGGLGARQIIGGIQDAAFAVAGMETGLGAVAGGASGARSEMAFVRGEADRLGLSFKDGAQSLLSLSAATNGTILQGAATREVWLGLNEAGVALNLTNERQGLAMQALSQMASKQVISQEELRGQLAEALPGAYQVAQRAMGLTGREFNKLVASGNLLANDFLPKFASQLRKEFGPSVDQSLTSPLGRARVEIAETKNSLFDLQGSAGGAFLGGLTSGLSDLNDELKDPDARAAAAELGRSLGEGVGEGARAIGVLVDHIDEVGTALGVVTAIGVARWLATMTAEVRGSAAAFLAKGQAAALASAQIQAGAGGEQRAITTLRGAVEAGARAELQSALAAKEAAIAHQAVAQATLAEHRATLVALGSGGTYASRQAAYTLAERELAAAKLATVAASGRAEAAQMGLAKASTFMGAAMTGARGMASGLVALLGGPFGIAFLAAAAAAALLANHLAKAQAETAEFDATTRSVASALEETAKYSRMAGDGVGGLGINSANATKPTDDLAKAMGRFADETYRAAAAQKTLAINSLMKEAALVGSDITRLEGKLKAEKVGSQAVAAAMLGDAAFSPLGQQQIAAAGNVSKSLNQSLLEQRRKEDAAIQGRIRDLAGTDTLDFAPPKPAASSATSTGKADRQALGAQVKATDLAAAVVAQQQYRTALLAGGAALDEWRVKEAGRQAVERLALADRPKLNAAEQALVATIKSRAEETERLKLADERIEAAIGLRKTMEADTAALMRRADATAKGEKALEDLQVTEAGLQALQRLGVDSLGQLTGAALEEAKAAMASAEARERQAIATQNADRVAQSLRSMDEQIADEKAHTLALAGGTKAQVDYARAEFVRQEIERAGKTLTAEQIAQIREKAEALFALQAVTAASTADADAAEELRLSQLTNRERELEIRLKDRARLLQAQKKDLTEEEATAQARLVTLQAMEAEDRARAVGDLKEAVKQAYIDGGELGLDEVKDYAERKLREAIYNAWLAKPIDIIVNAVVGSISGLTGSIGAAGAQGGIAGLASLFNGAGGLAGLASGSGGAIADLLMKGGMGGLDAMKFGGMAGGAIGGAGTGMLVSGLASALGLKQTKGNQIGGTIGGAIGSFVPIPGGALIGSVLGNLVGGLLAGKKSNEAAVLDLDTSGKVTSIGGAKRNEQSTAAAQSIADAVAGIQAALVAGGATLGATVSKIDIGHRDATHLNFSNGQAMDTAVGDVNAAIEAATKTIIANAKWATEAQTAYAQQMIAAGASLDEVVSRLQLAGTFSASIDDAIGKLTDPAAYEKKAALAAIEANYQALKTQAQELIGAGLATTDVLGKLDKLRDLEITDALKRLGEAADDAADRLRADQDAAGSLSGSINDDILSILDPVAFKTKSALDKVERDYQARLAEANRLIKAGVLGGEVIGQLDTLKGLQIDQVFRDLAGAAVEAVDAFAEARPQLQSWLDGLVASNDNQLNPAEELKLAKSQYDRQLARAQGGDADALANITAYADRYIAADREATSSAADRLLTVNRVTGDIGGLTRMGGSNATSSAPVVAALQPLAASLALLVTNTSGPEGGGLAGALTSALSSKPIMVGNIPDFAPILTQVAGPQTDRLAASIEKLRADLVVKLEEVRAASTTGLSAVSEAVKAGLNAVESAVDGVASSNARQEATLLDQANEQRLQAAFLRQRVA